MYPFTSHPKILQPIPVAVPSHVSEVQLNLAQITATFHGFHSVTYSFHLFQNQLVGNYTTAICQSHLATQPVSDFWRDWRRFTDSENLSLTFSVNILTN